MRESGFLLGLIFLLLLGCRSKPVEIPAGVLPEDTMTLVMVDLQLAESALSQSGMDSLERWRSIYTSAVFMKHNITQAAFDSSFRFYQYHPALLEKMLEQVIIILSKQQTEDFWAEEKGDTMNSPEEQEEGVMENKVE